MQCGALVLLQPLLPMLREGPAHRQHEWLSGALAAFSAGLIDASRLSAAATAAGLRAVVGYALATAAGTDPTQNLAMKDAVFDRLCVSALATVHTDALLALLTEPARALGDLPSTTCGSAAADGATVAWLHAVTQAPGTALARSLDADGGDTDAHALSAALYLQACCYRLLQVPPR